MKSHSTHITLWLVRGILGLSLGLGAYLLMDQPAKTSPSEEAASAKTAEGVGAADEFALTNVDLETERETAPQQESQDASQRAADAAAPAEEMPSLAELKPARIPLPEGGPAHVYQGSVALLIRCEDYHDVTWDEMPRNGSLNEALKKSLEGHGFVVRELINPTAATLKARLRGLPQEFAAPDAASLRVLVYFSGHARTIRDGTGEQLTYLAPVDAPKPGEQRFSQFRAAAVSLAELQTTAENLRAQHVLFIVNAPAQCSFINDKPREALSPRLAAGQRARHFIIASPAEGEWVWGADQINQFQGRLLSGFAGGADANKDGCITGTELGAHVNVWQSTDEQSTNLVNPYHGPLRIAAFENGEFLLQGKDAGLAGNNSPPHASIETVNPIPPAPATLEAGPVANVTQKPFQTPEGLRMIWVKEGSYELLPTADFGEQQVVPIKGFWMADSEVGGTLFERMVMEGPPHPERSSDAPVEGVSFRQAMAFCALLNSIHAANLPQGYSFRLPTEEEWEYISSTQSGSAFRIVGGGLAIAPSSPERSERKSDAPNIGGIRALTSGLREWCQTGPAPTPDATGTATQATSAPSPDASAAPAPVTVTSALPGAVVRGDVTPNQTPLENSSLRFVHYETAKGYSEVGFRVVLAPQQQGVNVRPTSAYDASNHSLATLPATPTAASATTTAPALTKSTKELFASSKYEDWGDYNHRLILKKAQGKWSTMKASDGKPLYPEGGIDGAWGQGTVSALTAFQSIPENHLKVTGLLDDATLAALQLDQETKKSPSPSSSSSSKKEKTRPGYTPESEKTWLRKGVEDVFNRDLKDFFKKDAPPKNDPKKDTKKR